MRLMKAHIALKTLLAGSLMLAIGGFLLLGNSAEASNLPPCTYDQDKFFDNCFGAYIWTDGDKYVGEWKDNNRNGQGTYTYANGDKYVGEYRDDKRHGQGTD